MATIDSTKPFILIVTGYSGAGKSTVLRALEDVGFYCVDNLPLSLFDQMYSLILQSKIDSHRIALGIDIRTSHSPDELVSLCSVYKNVSQATIKICFLTASSRVLLRRFQETRRKHPLAQETKMSDAIALEIHTLRPLLEVADVVLDTDTLTIHQLRSFVGKLFADNPEQKMVVNLLSFGFKYGVPDESNFVYDVRSLPNPYFVPELKELTGMDSQIDTYLFQHQEVQEYWDKLIAFIQFSIEKSRQEERSFMKIAIGCTGGRHRSVAFVHRLQQYIKSDVHLLIEHRDLERS